jgi:hypothetical protein
LLAAAAGAFGLRLLVARTLPAARPLVDVRGGGGRAASLTGRVASAGLFSRCCCCLGLLGRVKAVVMGPWLAGGGAGEWVRPAADVRIPVSVCRLQDLNLKQDDPQTQL